MSSFGAFFRNSYNTLLYKVRQCTLRVKFFSRFFSIPFDRVWAADHENLILSLTENFLPLQKCAMFEWIRFFEKTHLFRKCGNFLTTKLNFCVIKLSYSESALKTASIDVCFQTFYRLSLFSENSSHRFR